MDRKARRKLDHLFTIMVSQKHFLFAKTAEELHGLAGQNLIGYQIPSGDLAFLDSLASQAYRDFFGVILDEREISRRLTSHSIDAIIKKHIFKYLEDAAQGHPRNVIARNVVADLFEELNSGGDESEVFFLANGLELEQFGQFEFGRGNFKKIDAQCAESLLPNFEFSSSPSEKQTCQPIPETRQRELNERRQRDRNSLMGETLLTVIERGDSLRSREAAYRECVITLGAFSVYPIIFTYEGTTPVRFRFSVSGLIPENFGEVIARNVKTGEHSWVIGAPFSLPSVPIRREDLDKFSKFGFDDLSQFLRERSGDKEIDKAIEEALFWLGEAAAEKTLAARLTKYFTTIETLIIGPHHLPDIVNKVASRLGVLVGQNVEEAKQIAAAIEKETGLYDLRSRVIHRGKSEIEDVKRVYYVGALAAWSILFFLKARGFKRLDDAIKRLDEVAEEILSDNQKSRSETTV